MRKQLRLFFWCERSKPDVMSCDRVVLCASHKSQRFVIERQVLRFYRQKSNQGLDDRTADRSWHTFIKLRPAKSGIHRISCEQFVAAVAAECNGHVFSREA